MTDCGSCIVYELDERIYLMMSLVSLPVTYLNVMLDNSFTQNIADLNDASVLNLQVDSFRC
jgi:hypothetical protein